MKRHWPFNFAPNILLVPMLGMLLALVVAPNVGVWAAIVVVPCVGVVSVIWSGRLLNAPHRE